MAEKFRQIIGVFIVKIFSRENVSALIDQLLDALYEERLPDPQEDEDDVDV